MTKLIKGVSEGCNMLGELPNKEGPGGRSKCWRLVTGSDGSNLEPNSIHS